MQSTHINPGCITETCYSDIASYSNYLRSWLKILPPFFYLGTKKRIHDSALLG